MSIIVFLRSLFSRPKISFFILLAFLTNTVSPLSLAKAGEMVLPLMPLPGTMVSMSSAYVPAHLMGLIIHPDDAFKFDFLIHQGDGHLTPDQKKQEYTKLVKYFLASLTVPDKDQWVNLSPYEHDRIIAGDFGKTTMGRDLLEEDYLLKQITSSLMFPEAGLGKAFWEKVYTKAWQDYHTTNVPVNTFNKVWIIPDKATVYESQNTAYVIQTHLKVMLEEDYLSLAKHQSQPGDMFPRQVGGTCPQARCQANKPMNVKATQVASLSRNVIRQIILPALEKEVNEGKNFAPLRQIVSAMILATWYKKVLKESLLGKIYADKAKIKGVDYLPSHRSLSSPNVLIGDPQYIYQQYLKAFKKGVYNYIKEDQDKYTHESIPRKYFAGGFQLSQAMVTVEHEMTEKDKNFAQTTWGNAADDIDRVKVNISPRYFKSGPLNHSLNQAMISPSDFVKMKHANRHLYIARYDFFDLLTMHEDWRSNYSFDPSLDKANDILGIWAFVTALNLHHNDLKPDLDQWQTLSRALTYDQADRNYILSQIKKDRLVQWVNGIRRMRFSGLVGYDIVFFNKSRDDVANLLQSAIGKIPDQPIENSQILALKQKVYPDKLNGQGLLKLKDPDAIKRELSGFGVKFDDLIVWVIQIKNAELGIKPEGMTVFKYVNDMNYVFDILIAKITSRLEAVGNSAAEINEKLKSWRLIDRDAAMTVDRIGDFFRNAQIIPAYRDRRSADIYFWFGRQGEHLEMKEIEEDVAKIKERLRFIGPYNDRIMTVLGQVVWYVQIKRPSDVVRSLFKSTTETRNDEAMHSFPSGKNGGIDLNSANLAMTIKHDGRIGSMQFFQQDMAQFSQMEGLEPHITAIRLATGLAIFREINLYKGN